MRRRFMISKNIDNSDQYFTIEALENGLTVSLSYNQIEYSIDQGPWNILPASTFTPSINKKQIISFRGEYTNSRNGTFTISKKCNLKGNIMSLIYKDGFKKRTDMPESSQLFYRLFYQCTQIINSNQLILPALTLQTNCYQNMFEGCSNMLTTPELPAKTLTTECYNHMFSYCSSLTTAPELPATTLAKACYNYMFNTCINLIEAPILKANILAERCYRGMFSNCIKLNNLVMLATNISASECLQNWVNGVATNGTFTKKSQMTSIPNNSISGIPQGWVINNV